jgi:hypothetical protein
MICEPLAGFRHSRPPLTILQHLAPECEPLSRKFHTFHFSAICRVFTEILLFAGLAKVGTRERWFGAPERAMAGLIHR